MATDMVLLVVRPVGTIEWGELTLFVRDWVSDLTAALELAHRISDRPQPWEPWTGP